MDTVGWQLWQGFSYYGVLRNAVLAILNSRGHFSWLQNRGLWTSPWSENCLSIPKLCAFEKLDGLVVRTGRAEDEGNEHVPLFDVERKACSALFRKNNVGVYWFLTSPSVGETQCSVFLQQWQALGGCGCAHPGQDLLSYSWGPRKGAP